MDADGSPGTASDVAAKTSITCSNMPESLFDTALVKKHFGRFGRVRKISLRPKKQICVVEYDSGVAAQRALLNAGAYDGFMFDVTWTKKKKVRRDSASEKKRMKDEDLDWVPDSDVEEELSAMSTLPVYRQPRQQPMQQELSTSQSTVRSILQGRANATKVAAKDRPSRHTTMQQQVAAAGATMSAETPALVTMPTTMSTSEAAAELQQLRARVSRTHDEQRRTLDARDRILRAWGGTGVRVRAGGATIGTCPDMCPEKERLQRQAEHQVMSLECEAGQGGEAGAMAEWRAVKQYSRSSADQETPMCFELRPPHVLAMTMNYLLREIADCTDHSQVSLADWFHFMWDRCRGIRKDITQQALCCAESVRLVEQCARFHAHCAARLADLEHAQFDPRLNTDNLTKCLQTLKHMYADLPPASKPCEAEFRSYVALLNLGDANFCWEIKQLPQEIQKSEAITFAVQIFMALDNNNYIRFFRLVKERATYLQACILLRYFNDVRARGLARIVKSFAPRGGSKYPMRELMNNLAFEDFQNLQTFIMNYGLRVSENNDGLGPSVELNRQHFIEDSNPYPTSREVNIIESKRNSSVGEVIAGGPLPDSAIYKNHIICSSFHANGTLKLSALLAEDQGYGTNNESNKNLSALKKELERTPQPEMGIIGTTFKGTEPRFTKPDTRTSFVTKQNAFSSPKSKDPATTSKVFSFKPAIPVVSSEVVKSSPEKLFTQDTKTIFSFSKPEDNKTTGLWGTNKSTNVFGALKPTQSAFSKPTTDKTVIGNQQQIIPGATKDVNVHLTSSVSLEDHPFAKPELPSAVFESAQTKTPALFSRATNQQIFKSEMDENNYLNSNMFKKATGEVSLSKHGNVFQNSRDNTLFAKPNTTSTLNIFSKASKDIVDKETSEKGTINVFATEANESVKVSDAPRNVFGQAPAPQSLLSQVPVNVFNSGNPQAIFGQNVELNAKSTGNLFVHADTGSIKNESRSLFAGASNVFNKQNNQESTSTIKMPSSPKTLFKSAFPQNQDAVKTSFGSALFEENKVLNAAFGPLTQQPNVIDIHTFEDEQLREQQMQGDLRRKQREQEEKQRIEEAKRLEEQRIQEQKRLEEMRKAELRRQEELRKREEEMRKQEELRKRLEEEHRQAELKRLAEEKRKEEELKKKAEERKRLVDQIDRESRDLVDELVSSISVETVEKLLVKEKEEMSILIECAHSVTDEVLQEVCGDICYSEVKAEKFLSEKLMAKYGGIWIAYTARNIRRRMLVQETPVWLADRSPLQTANLLRRRVLPAALEQMNAFHRGYCFTGETTPDPTLKPYNIMEVVRTSLLKGLQRVNVHYHKCFFWKVTISSPGVGQWLNRRVELHDWLLKKFSDKERSSCDRNSVIYLKKHSWNNLLYFAISVTMTELQNEAEIMNGSNGIIFYTNENDSDLLSRVSEQLKSSPYSRHTLPVAVVASTDDTSDIELRLSWLVSTRAIPAYKIFHINKQDTFGSLDKCTKSALKWLAKNVPDIPPLEMDSLKSVLLRCVGTEWWYRLKLERHTRMNTVYKDLSKLIMLYNVALENVATIITDESVHAYSSFPAELKPFLENNSVFPKSYEFFPNDWMNTENIERIRTVLQSLTLPQPNSLLYPLDPIDLQEQIKNFCAEINWFQNPLEVSYKIISHLPKELFNLELSKKEFSQYFEHYDFLDILSIVVVEKINSTSEMNDKYVFYNRSTLTDFRNAHWWYEIELVSSIKHKADNFAEDEIDNAVNDSLARSAKRMRYDESDELLALEEKDETLVEESINKWTTEINNLSSCNDRVLELEKRLEEEAVRSSNIEELLRAALHDGCSP